MYVEREKLLQPTRVGLPAEVEKKIWHYYFAIVVYKNK